MIFFCGQAARAEPPSTAAPAFKAYPWAAYTVEYSGDVLEGVGATVQLSSKGGDVKPFGSATADIDATPFRYHRLRLSADLATKGAIEGTAIWLRADVAGKSRAFMNSQAQPVHDGSGPGHRQVEIDVPGDADHLLFGVILMKQGEATASYLTLADLGMETSSPLAKPTLEAAIDIVRKNAYHSRNVDWSRVEPQVRARAGDRQYLSDARAAIALLLAELNDRHSHQIDVVAAAAAPKEGRPEMPTAVERRGDDLGYLSLPGFSGTNPALMDAFSTPLSKAVVALSPRCGWILDLRHNAGGNMRPMLAALRPLLGGSPAGSFEYADGRIVPWPVLGSTTVDQSTMPVAVLTGHATASSGEIVAIAFNGRANARSFGAGTAGLSTSNATFPLPDGSAIALTVAVDRNRDGRVYGGVVEPDQPVDDASAEAAAEAWLREKCPSKASRSASP